MVGSKSIFMGRQEEMRTLNCEMEELVNRLESEMGLLDFQAEQAVNSQATIPAPAPGTPVTLRQALEYSGVVYVRGGMRRHNRVRRQAFSTQAYFLCVFKISRTALITLILLILAIREEINSINLKTPGISSNPRKNLQQPFRIAKLCSDFTHIMY